jgi:hypothetical protein
MSTETIHYVYTPPGEKTPRQRVWSSIFRDNSVRACMVALTSGLDTDQIAEVTCLECRLWIQKQIARWADLATARKGKA